MSAKLVAKVVGGSVLAFGLTVIVPSVASASASAAAPSASVVPSSGLSDGTVVQVSGTGLKPGVSYRVGECAQVQVGQFACNEATKVDIVADADGVLSTSLTVNSTFEGIRFDGTSAGTVDCKAVACAAGMGDATGDGAGVTLSFE